MKLQPWKPPGSVPIYVGQYVRMPDGRHALVHAIDGHSATVIVGRSGARMVVPTKDLVPWT